MNTITAHCLIKNEENFIGYAVKSVVDFVDKIIVFDTGSTDKTAEIIKSLAAEYPNKIIFEEKGESDEKRHTELRQEMIARTTTDWFMVLDGDEVWPRRAMLEAKQIIDGGAYDGIRVPFYECVGDIYHNHRVQGYKAARFVKMGDVSWQGKYDQDTLYTREGEEFFEIKKIYKGMHNRYWHLTHLRRSSYDNEDYSSGGLRRKKRIPTYFLVGKRIHEPAPEVCASNKKLALSKFKSFILFFVWVVNKMVDKIINKF